ncbi:hypothetical protein [Streptomyces malaysiensis]|uniref:hypothetical protein n=1 Tax=Streptomyces malaysiensis TaxID=92644 RepID=UPI0008538632|nr:hypothetical protein [Streptomyces sp. SPMA113]
MSVEDTPSHFPPPDAATRLCTRPKVDFDLVGRATQFLGTAQAPADPLSEVYVESVMPVHWDVDGDLVAVHSDGTVATRPTGKVPPLHVLEAGTRELLAHSSEYVPVPTRQPTAETIASGFLEMGRPVPDVVQALNARQAALLDDTPQIDAFTSDVLGLWSGWRESVSTALLGDWASPLLSSGSLAPTALDCLRAEVRIIHRQMTPVSRRRVAGERLWSLDFRFGDDLTTYDLISGGPDPYEVLTGALPDDPRVATVLAQLRPIEHAVAMAWASTRVTSWAEAAADVIALDPAQFTGCDPRALGERVRTKLIRLGKRHTERAAAAAAWKGRPA